MAGWKWIHAFYCGEHMKFSRMIGLPLTGRPNASRQGLTRFRLSGLAWLLGLVLLGVAANARGQLPTITSFTASPASISAGQSTSLRWMVSGAAGLSIDNGLGGVTGTNQSVSPVVTTTYTLTATNAASSRTAATTVTVGPWPHYDIAYQSTLQGSWIREAWENNPNDLFTDFAAIAPGRTGNAIEVRFGPNQGYLGFGLADRKPGYDVQYKYLNEFRTLEFDIYFEPDSTRLEEIEFILEDAYLSDEPKLVDLIPGWTGMTEPNSSPQACP